MEREYSEILEESEEHDPVCLEEKELEEKRRKALRRD